MTRLVVVMTVAVAGCAQAPDGLLVVTGEGELEPFPARVDVYLGVDRGLAFAPLTATRPLVLDALPDDLDRPWDDTSRPYQVLLTEIATRADLYVVLRGHQGDRGFGGNLRKPVSYPGDGLYQVTADLFAPDNRGACVHGTAEDAGYEVELVPVLASSAVFDCDRDAVPYPEDCTDYDEAIRPMPAYPPTSGIETPDALMCCNGDAPQPAVITVRNGGPTDCRMSVGCPGAPPYLVDLELPWAVTAPNGDGGSYCHCVAELDHDPLECLTDAHLPKPGDPNMLLQHPFCDLAIDDDGAVCPGQVYALSAHLQQHLPPDGPCNVRVVWQAGAASLRFRDPATGELSDATTSCDALLEFEPAGPPPGHVTQNGAFGWYILDVDDRLVAMHTHPQATAGCDRPPSCALE